MSQIDKIYIARHGYRMNWVTNDWKSETGLPRDPPLAAYGVSQAKELASHFLSLPEEERPTAIFSSPYYRCLQTSQPTSEALDIPIFVEHGLSEWYSPAKAGTGLHPRPASATDLKEYFPQIDPMWSSIYYPTRKGETFDQVHDRVGNTLQALLPTVKRRLPSKHSRILLVSHAATVIALSRELIGDRGLPLRIGCCSLTEVVRKDDAADAVLGAWTAVALAKGDHLAEGATRDWGFEDALINEKGEVIEDHGIPGTEHEIDHPVGVQIQEATSRM